MYAESTQRHYFEGIEYRRSLTRYLYPIPLKRTNDFICDPAAVELTDLCPYGLSAYKATCFSGIERIPPSNSCESSGRFFVEPGNFLALIDEVRRLTLPFAPRMSFVLIKFNENIAGV